MTYLISLTSRPLAAMSVATRILTYPLRNLQSALSLYAWLRSPCRVAALCPLEYKYDTISSHLIFLPKNTNVFPESLPMLSNNYTNLLPLNLSGTKSMTYQILLLIVNWSVPIWTCIWLVMYYLAKDYISLGQVALNIRVYLSALIVFMTSLNSFSNPMSHILSASSNTIIVVLSKTMTPSCMKSSSLPGVAINTSTLFSNYLYCIGLLAPPYT